MKSYLFFIISIFVILERGYSQNLVPNGSFESYSNCPNNSSQIYFTTGWFQPCKYPGGYSVNQSSSSDYYNFCANITTVSIPNNFVGFQYANTGNGYIGISYYNYPDNGNAYREYAEVQLNQTLIANKKYNLKYYVSLANISPLSITKFDAYFSHDTLIYVSPIYYRIPITPQIQYNTRISDTLNWVEVNGSFIANGTENFLTLGNFHDGIDSDTLRCLFGSSAGSGSYYYIDDVSLEEDTIIGIDEIYNADLSLFPIPANRNFQISSQEIIREVVLMDIRGKVVLRENSPQKNSVFDVSQLNDGIYIVQCKFKSGEVIYKKVIVQH